MADIIHRIGIKSSGSELYKALATTNGLAGWWTEEVSGRENVGSTLTFTFRSKDGTVKGSMVMEVKESDPDTGVKWKCLSGPDEWVGTDITFRWSYQDNQTILIFGHRNWKEPVEFMAHCSMKWAVFLLSLRQYLETGKGNPTPHDQKIDNWN